MGLLCPTFSLFFRLNPLLSSLFESELTFISRDHSSGSLDHTLTLRSSFVADSLAVNGGFWFLSNIKQFFFILLLAPFACRNASSQWCGVSNFCFLLYSPIADLLRYDLTTGDCIPQVLLYTTQVS